MSPARSGPDPHFHRTISESFFVISGSIKLFDGRDWLDARPGDFLYVPEGGIHGLRNESGADASMLILRAGRASRGLFRDAGSGLVRGVDDRRGANRVHAPPRYLLGLMAEVVPFAQLEPTEHSHEFVGAEHSDVPFSVILVHSRPGSGRSCTGTHIPRCSSSSRGRRRSGSARSRSWSRPATSWSARPARRTGSSTVGTRNCD